MAFKLQFIYVATKFVSGSGNGPFLSNERCRASPCPFFLLKGCLAAGNVCDLLWQLAEWNLWCQKGTQRQPLNMSWGTAQFSLLWLWNKEEKQQRNLDVSSDEDSTLGLLENSGAVQVLVLSRVIISRGKSTCFHYISPQFKKKKKKNVVILTHQLPTQSFKRNHIPLTKHSILPCLLGAAASLHSLLV